MACSGGLDSTVLLHALHRWPQRRFELVALHVDHALRPQAERQEEFAILLANALACGVTLRVHALAPGAIESLARLKGTGIEAAARTCRYQAFAEFRQGLGLDLIVTAHHRDDDLESFLMALFRGQSFSRSIPAAREGYCRPLISFERGELEALVRHWGLAWHEESSNASPRYLRNRVRHELLPLLAGVFPGFRTGLFRLRHLAGLDEAYIDSQLAGLDWQPGLLDWPAEGYPPDSTVPVRILDLAALLDLPDALYWRCIRQGALAFLQDGSLKNLPEPSGLLDSRPGLAGLADGGLLHIGGLRLVRLGGKVCMSPCIVAFHKNDYLVLVNSRGPVAVPGLGRIVLDQSFPEHLLPLELRPFQGWQRILGKSAISRTGLARSLAACSCSGNHPDTVPLGRCPDGSWLCFAVPWPGAVHLDRIGSVKAELLDTIRLQRRQVFNCEQLEQQQE